MRNNLNTTKNSLPKKKIVASSLVLLLAFSVTVAPFSASETSDLWRDVENYYFDHGRMGKTRCGQLYWKYFLDKRPENYSGYDVYVLKIYTDFTPGDALDHNRQYLHDAYVKLNLKTNRQYIDDILPDPTQSTDVSVDYSADTSEGGGVKWDIDINNWAGRLKYSHDFTFTALVKTDPGAAADGLIEIWTKWTGNGWGLREKRTEQISYYYDFGGDDGEDGEIGTDPTDPDSTPIAGMKPILFYGLVGGGIALIVAIGVLIYFKKRKKGKEGIKGFSYIK